MPVFQEPISTTSNGLFNPKREQNILLESSYNESHNDKLMPTWNRLAYALLSNCSEGQIEVFIIWHIDLTKKVMEVLATSLESLSIKWLSIIDSAMDISR